MTWKQSEDRFLESDVVKWTEAIWPPQRSRRSKKKRRPWGRQAVTGQILSIDGDLLEVRVLKAEILENEIGSKLMPHKPGTVIRKKTQTLLKGEPERLHWSEEDVRDALGLRLIKSTIRASRRGRLRRGRRERACRSV